MALQKTHNGLTLVELLIASAILATLAMIALPVAELTVKRQKEAELKESLRSIRNALDAYKQAVDTGKIVRNAVGTGYPKKLEDLVDGMENQTDPERRKLYFLRRIPLDPFTSIDNQTVTHNWQLRSYASSAANPAQGDDVYDVYSQSKEIGDNGIAYAKW